MLLFLLILLFLLVTGLALYAALHVPQQDPVALLLEGFFLLVNALLVAVLPEAFVLVFRCVVLLAIGALLASLFLFLFAVLVLLAAGCAVFLFQRNSLW